jgi:hypothetical protein
LAEDMNAQRRGVVQRWYGEDTRVEFKDIRPEDKEAQRAELAAYAPFYTLNELRELTGQEAFPDDDVRGLMLIAEVTKGAPLPGTPAALLLEDLQAEKDEEEAQKQADLVEQGLAPDPMQQVDETGAPLAPPPPEEGAPAVAEAKAVDDLELWERKALKSFRRFKKADVSFDTITVSLPEQARIHEALKGADSVPAIKAAFRQPRTALGEALMDIRNRGAALLLDEDEIEAEVKARRGGVDDLLDSVDAEARQWAEEAMSE